MHVLYVEDDPLDADLTRRALNKKAPQIQLDIARTQNEALQLLQRHTVEGSSSSYDLLLTDLNLPDGGGFELLSYVRERKYPMAVVMITGQGDEEIAVSVLKAGADDYLVKRQGYLDQLPRILASSLQRYYADVERRERRLRVLYLESTLDDVEKTRQYFASHTPHINLEIIHSVAELNQRLPGDSPVNYDVLMMDYQYPQLDTLDLLKELRQVRNLDLPIVLVASYGGEEVAAQALRLGVNDYVVKNPGYLDRLSGLVENAYHRAQLLREQAALRTSEERYRRLVDNAPDIVYRVSSTPILEADAEESHYDIEYISAALTTVTGYTPQEILADLSLAARLIHPDDAAMLQHLTRDKYLHGEPFRLRLYHKDGRLLWLEVRNVPVFDEAGSLVAYEGVARDVTEHMRAEANIQRQLQRLNALRMVDTSITASLDLRVTLSVLLEHVTAQLGVHAADVLLFNANTQTLDYSAGIGFRSAAVEELHVHLGEGYAGQAALQRRTFHIPDKISDAGQVQPGESFSYLWAEEGFVAYYGTPLIAKGQVKGVLEVYHRAHLSPDSEWLNYFETLAGQAAIAIDNSEMFESIRRANLELLLAYDNTLEGWVRALDLRDKETQDHTERVTGMTLHLARAMGVNETALLHIRRGALLHDIGKMGIPDGLLHKPGPLAEDEWEVMRKHPVYAYELLSPVEYLRPAVDIPYCHHEWWDGTGYPRGLKGEEIPLAARLFAIVDVWDALTSDRPYRQKWDQERVIEYLRAQSGTHFDPQVVEKFVEVIKEGSFSI